MSKQKAPGMSICGWFTWGEVRLNSRTIPMDQSAGMLSLQLDFIIETTARTHLWCHLMAKPSGPVTHHTLVNTSRAEGELLNQPKLISSLRRAEWGQIWRDKDVMSEAYTCVKIQPEQLSVASSCLLCFFSCDIRETSDGTCSELLTEQLRRRWWRWSTWCHTPHHTLDSPYRFSHRWFSSVRPMVNTAVLVFSQSQTSAECDQSFLLYQDMKLSVLSDFCNVAELINTLPEASQTSGSSFMMVWCLAGVL